MRRGLYLTCRRPFVVGRGICQLNKRYVIHSYTDEIKNCDSLDLSEPLPSQDLIVNSHL